MVKILHLEDNPHDNALLVNILCGSFSCEVQRVGDKTEFERALCSGKFDIILSTFELPSFSGSEALQLARKINPEVPFLFVSTPIGEPAAVECIKKGAADFLLKEAPERIVPAISRALEEARQRGVQTKNRPITLTQSESFVRNGVAHEINNVLLPIVLAAEMLQAESSAQDRSDWIDIILSSAQRGVAIMKRVAETNRSAAA